MLERDPRGGFARHAGRHDELALPQRQRGAAGDAGEDRDVEDADGDDRVDRPGPEDSCDQDGDNDGRKGKDQIIAAHDNFIHEAPTPRRSPEPQWHARAHADPHCHQRHSDRGARADHDHAQNIAAKVIRAHRMRQRWAAQLVRDVEPGIVIRRPDKGDQRRQQKDRGQRGPKEQVAVHVRALSRGSTAA